MKIVYSLWSAPRPMTADHRVCLALSSIMAREKYDEVELVTDTAGARLAAKMQLPFTAVSTHLDVLRVSPGAWAAGKLMAYSIQDRPFIHVDHDVFLFNALPDRILTAPLVAQSAEGPEMYVRARSALPTEVADLLMLPTDRWAAYNAGILGGNDVEFLNDYGRAALNVIHDLQQVDPAAMTAIEQAFFARRAADAGKPVELLLEHDEDADGLGYCHLMCAKQKPDCMGRVRRKLEENHPLAYQRAILVGATP